jgi:CDP-paratose 2-epimerase
MNQIAVPRVKALITGSAGLIGSSCVELLCGSGWDVVGLDNDMRAAFFGPQASTANVAISLSNTFRNYQHTKIDIRDRAAVRTLLQTERPDLIIHAAAQPSHDKASSIPYDDFDINAGGTLNLLVAARDFCRDTPFCFTSTNKVYGDHPNHLELIETETRFDYADGRDGIDESMSVDQCTHSLFGVSKTSADLLCQEFGRYYDMPVGVFRGGCLTGHKHASVELHGFLSYITNCATAGQEYTIFGYKGKQVRDQIDSRDVARLFMEFYHSPRRGEVYNLGGGRANSISILETIRAFEDRGLKLQYRYDEQHRVGDHICYITDLTKVQSHFPRWQIRHSLADILDSMTERRVAAMRA